MLEKPLLSIITVNLNNLEGLKKTMPSVFDQTWRDFEYIVIDGGSTDGSKEYIEEHADKLDYWVSEPDKGIYNAMNKGILKASGEFLLSLNSGDWLHKANIIENTKSFFTSNYSIYYGDVERIYKGNKKELKTYPAQLNFSFFIESALAHQAVFIKRSLFFDLFLYNETYKVLADWEFLIVAICKYNIQTYYLNRVISYYPMDGLSSSPEGHQIMIEEREKCYREHFPLFINDYRVSQALKKNFNNPRVQLLLKLEKKPKLSRINYFFMRILNKFI